MGLGPRHAALLAGVLSTSVVALGGCGKDTSDIQPSFVMRGAAYFHSGDHLVEMVIHEGHVYVANSWRGLGVLRLEDDGSLTVTDSGDPLGMGEVRCTTLALHAPSDTLYCSADSPRTSLPEGVWVERFDISDPGHPVRLESLEIQHWAVRDLEVFEGTLLIHQFDDGLWTAKIAGDGSLSDLQLTSVPGNARISVVVGDRLVTAFSDPEGGGTQLRVLDPADFGELARLSLDGPPLGLSAEADGSRLAVGLGSGGMAIVAVDLSPGQESLTHLRTLHPPAVVTYGVLDGERAYPITLSGAFAYSLGAAPSDPKQAGEAALFGFAAEGTPGFERDGNMLHALLHEGDLITSDWTWIERWEIVEDGQIVALDLPRGVHVRPDGDVSWQMRSVGDTPLRAELWFGGDHLFDVDIDGPGITQVELPAKERAKLLAHEPRAQINIRVHDPAVGRSGEPLSKSSFVILQREADDPLPPAVGDPFPTLTLADRDMQPFELPLAGGTQTMLLAQDCYLQFPQFEDLAWHARNGRDLGRGTPVILSNVDIYLDRFANRWSLESLRVGFWGNAAPPEMAGVNDGLGVEVYDALWLAELPSGAQSTDYVIDEDGTILSVTRMYRGEWALTPKL